MGDIVAITWRKELGRKLRHAAKSATRRKQRYDAGVCINGPASGSVGPRGAEHGPVISGGKCARCIAVHARSA